MPLFEVVDASDPRVHDFTGLTDVELRRATEPVEGLFMAESLSVIQRAVAAGYRLRSVLTESKWLAQISQIGDASDPLVYVADKAVLEQITGYRLHRGLMAAMDRKVLPPAGSILTGTGNILVLDGLVDHTNVGACFRSAAAMGIEAVLVTNTCADPLYRRSVRVSMGAVFQVPWTSMAAVDLVDQLASVHTIALTPAEDADDLVDLVAKISGPTALIVGSEGPGLAAEVLARADYRAKIPMSGGVDSLNVAAAVAVAGHILTRARIGQMGRS